MRHSKTCTLAIIVLLFVAVGASVGAAGVVTVDVAKKSAKSDVGSLDPKVVRVKGDQVGIYIQSTVPTPQDVLVKYNGLKDQDYDVYVNREYVCAKLAAALAEGYQTSTPGTIADPAAIRCMTALKDKVQEAYDNLKPRKGPEPWRATYTLSQANTWISAGLLVDPQYRSVEIIIVPAGRALAKMIFATRRTAEEAKRLLRTYCYTFQDARDRMYHPRRGLKDTALRNYVVKALTPVTLTATYALVNGKPRVTAVLANDVDFAISGKISMAAPKGWKLKAGKLDFASLGSGKTFTAPIELTPIKTGTPPPQSVTMYADLTIVQSKDLDPRKLVTYDPLAKLRLDATANLKKP